VKNRVIYSARPPKFTSARQAQSNKVPSFKPKFAIMPKRTAETQLTREQESDGEDDEIQVRIETH
jgi:hypothetical protein